MMLKFDGALRSTIAGALSATVLISAALADPLPSWRDTASKARIIAFVDAVTNPASDDYVTPAERIAVFDNDGTLWSEQPLYFQILFALDRVREMAAVDPSILSSDTLKAAAEGDVATLAAGGTEAIAELMMVTHSGMSVETYRGDVTAWLDAARHPQTGLRFDEMVYQPMLELLRYLRDEDFETFIVTGGGIVGFVAISLLLPIFSASSLASGG